MTDDGGVGDGVELLEELREQNRQHEYEQLPYDRPAREVLLIRTVKEQDVQVVQIVMQKVIGERIVDAVDAFLTFDRTETALDAADVHNEIFYHGIEEAARTLWGIGIFLAKQKDCRIYVRQSF